MSGIRFSLRWLLAATAYVALITAAIATRNELLADLLWIVFMLAFVYSGVVACIERHQRQAMAIGFLLAATIYVVGLYLLPERVSFVRFFSLAGYAVGVDGEVYLYTSPTTYDFVPGIARATNAAGTLAAGLIGSMIGFVASRQAASRTRSNKDR